MLDRVKDASGRAILPAALWVLGIVVWCALAGLLAGELWMSRWSPPPGAVVGHVWYPDPWDSGNRSAFAATAWFAMIALGLGIVTGVLAAVLSRAGELLTLLAVLAGTCLASWLMWRHGVHTAPPDPAVAAKTAKDGTRMLGTLSAPGWSARAFLPLGGVLGLGSWFLLVPGRKHVGSEPARPVG